MSFILADAIWSWYYSSIPFLFCPPKNECYNSNFRIQTNGFILQRSSWKDIIIVPSRDRWKSYLFVLEFHIFSIAVICNENYLILRLIVLRKILPNKIQLFYFWDKIIKKYVIWNLKKVCHVILQSQ